MAELRRMLTRRPIITICVGLAIAASILGFFAVRDDRDSLQVEHYPVNWTLATAPGADSMDVTLNMIEPRCASGVPVAQRMDTPKITYTADTITIAITARLDVGPQRCSEPENTATIHLKEPVGSRKLVDGNA